MTTSHLSGERWPASVDAVSSRRPAQIVLLSERCPTLNVTGIASTVVDQGLFAVGARLANGFWTRRRDC
jgi:hypothetical protein